MRKMALLLALLVVLSSVVVVKTTNAAVPSLTISAPHEGDVVNTRKVWLNYTVSGATEVNYQLLPNSSVYDMPPRALENISLPATSSNVQIQSYPGVDQQLIVWAKNAEGTVKRIINFSSSVNDLRILVLGDTHVSYYNATGQNHKLNTLNGTLQAVADKYPDGWDFLIQVGDLTSFCSNTVPPSSDSSQKSDNASFWVALNTMEKYTPRGRIFCCIGNHDFEEHEGYPGKYIWQVPTMKNWTTHYLHREIDNTISPDGNDEKANISVGLGNLRVLIPAPDSQGRGNEYGNMTFDFAQNWFYDKVSTYAPSNIIMALNHYGLYNSTASIADRDRDTKTEDETVIPLSDYPGYPDFPSTASKYYDAVRNYTVDFWIHGHMHYAFDYKTRSDGTPSWYAWKKYTSIDQHYGKDAPNETFVLNAGGEKNPYSYGDTGAKDEAWMFIFNSGSNEVDIHYGCFSYPSTMSWGYSGIPEWNNITLSKTFILGTSSPSASFTEYDSETYGANATVESEPSSASFIEYDSETYGVPWVAVAGLLVFFPFLVFVYKFHNGGKK